MDVNEELKFLGKLTKKKSGGGGGSGGEGVRLGGGGQGGCEQRIEVLGKIHTKKIRGESGGGVGLGGSGWM